MNKKGNKMEEKFLTLYMHVRNTHVKYLSEKMQLFATSVFI